MGMAADVQQTPFVKQLAANDRPTREKALASLQAYLTSTHQFTDLELLKIWKGLFFCMFHTSSPLPQQRLSRTLSSLLLSLPPPLFLPFLSAFYKTLTSQYAQLPSLRLDKYLYLLRRYVSAAFIYLLRRSCPPDLVRGYLDLAAGDAGPLSCGRGEQARVPDGVRYHVLDFWVPELKAALREREPVEREVGGHEAREREPEPVNRAQGEQFMEPVRALETSAKGKVVRKRAREVLREWEDKPEGAPAGNGGDGGDNGGGHIGAHISDEEWDGFGD